MSLNRQFIRCLIDLQREFLVTRQVLHLNVDYTWMDVLQTTITEICSKGFFCFALSWLPIVAAFFNFACLGQDQHI